MEGYYKTKKACEILKIHPRTLYQWEEKGWIETKRTKGNQRLYNVKKYLEENNLINKENEEKERYNICYARVSTISQKNDLENQKQELKLKYPNYILIEDIGSGMNLNKRGILKIIDWAIEGKINKIVVCYKDRLTRFGYEFIEYIIKKYSNGNIEILNKEEDLTDEQEVAMDIIQVLNIYTAEINGKRKYKKKNEKERDI